MDNQSGNHYRRLILTSQNNKYPELDLPTLQACAHDWANKYPCIHDITLYRAISEGQRDEIKYIFFVHTPKIPHGKLPLDEDEWTDEDVKHDEIIYYYNHKDEACSHISNEIPDFYMNKAQADLYAWMWFDLDVDEIIEEYNKIPPLPSPPFFRVNTGLVLYDRNLHKKFYDLPLDENLVIIVEKRNESIERMIWNKNIQPIVDLHYNGVFQYQFFPEPEIITQGDLHNMLQKTMLLCYQGYDLIFPTDVFEIEVMKRLYAGLTVFSKNENSGHIDLKDIFFNFLQELIDKKTLPLFLARLSHEYGTEGIWPREGHEQGSDSQKTTNLNIREPFNKKSPEEKLNQIFTEAKTEMETLYQDIKGEMKTRTKSMFDATVEIALSIYESKEKFFKMILLEDIKKSTDGFLTEKPSRDIKGRILLNVIKRKMPDEFINKTIPTNHQEIYNHYLDFKKA